MSEDLETREVAIDYRDETLVTLHPGFSATEQVVRDVAAERKLRLFQLYRILWSIFVFLEILMAIRLILRFIGANPSSGFAMFMYGFTGLYVGPFNGMVATPSFAGGPIEVTTIIAMIVYLLIFLGIAYVIQLVTDRPGASSFNRTTREQIPGGDGNVRTTRTIISNGRM